jgi:hypothetical protein
LAFALAPEDTVILDRRALRPLPPGRVQGNGSYAPDPRALIDGDVALTWAHRDRLTQTSPVIADYTAASIGPEPGVTYALEIRWVDPDTGAQVEPPAAVIDLGTATARTLTLNDIPAETAPERVVEIDVMVRARRSVGGSWLYARDHRSMRFAAPFAAGWGAAWGFNWGG